MFVTVTWEGDDIVATTLASRQISVEVVAERNRVSQGVGGL